MEREWLVERKYSTIGGCHTDCPEVTLEGMSLGEMRGVDSACFWHTDNGTEYFDTLPRGGNTS